MAMDTGTGTDTAAESTDHQMNSLSDMDKADDTADEQGYNFNALKILCC